MTLDEQIGILLAAKEGKGIERRYVGEGVFTTFANPDKELYDFFCFEYRVVEEPEIVLPSIDWSVLIPEWRWLAQSQNGLVCAFTHKPEPGHCSWVHRDGEAITSGHLSSLKPGKGDWRKLIVERPAEKEPWYPDDSGEWIEWGGGDCPVLGTKYVQIMLRYERDNRACGSVRFTAGPLLWRHDGGQSDIVAYKVVK